MTFTTPTGWKRWTRVCLFLLRTFYVRSALLKRSSHYNTPLSKAKETEAMKNCSCPDNWDSPSSLFLKTSQTAASEMVFPHKHPPEHLTLKCLLCRSVWTSERDAHVQQILTDECSSPDLQHISMQIISKLCKLRWTTEWAKTQACVWC